MLFDFTPQRLPEVLLIESHQLSDERGFFAETYRADVFLSHGIGVLVQDNHSRSRRGVLRGLHYQLAPRRLGKLVRCVRGEILDVAVDVRRDSPTLGQWVAVALSETNGRMLWVPPGFAHGFCVVSEVADVLYRQTDYYAPELERSVRWNDPALAIAWPTDAPTLSPRDAVAPLLAAAELA